MQGSFWNAVRTVFVAILDAVIPARERSVRTRTRTAEDLPAAPREHQLGRSTITALMEYHDRAVEDTIRALKYDGSRRAAKILADVLADYLHEEIVSLRAFSPRPVILVPVPLHPSRKRERGFNQMERVLAELPPEFRDGTLSRVVPALVRDYATPQQTRLSRSERLENVRGAFSADEKAVRGARVIVIDDVCTTGATLGECTSTLAAAGAKVTAIALARA